MSVRPKCATLVLLVSQMVDVTHNGLEEQQSEEDEADDGMVAVKQANLGRGLLSQPNTDADRRCVHQICEELEQAVDEPCTAEGAQANEDTADWEEEDERQ